jgi:hypothetical protein
LSRGILLPETRGGREQNQRLCCEMWDLLQKAVTKKLVCRIHLNIPVSLPQGRQSIQMLQRCHFDWYDWTDLRLPLILTAARYELLVQLLVIYDLLCFSMEKALLRTKCGKS